MSLYVPLCVCARAFARGRGRGRVRMCVRFAKCDETINLKITGDYLHNLTSIKTS